MGGRGVFDLGGLAPQPDEAEQLQILADAGISAEAVDLVVQARITHEHERALEDVRVLRAAENALYRHADVGMPVPEQDRWDKGTKVTETDDSGARRMLAAAIASAETTASAVDTSEQVAQTRSATIGGMCRREAEGKHADNLQLIDGARPRGRTGTWM
ncbi:hypothetical protein HJ588_11820 [Flexivirga sp. ID2601S]|jgi:hypothetical protein|uniref:Uncharacterized protein n=1 Tax=Flexivirga aerilata TaxID=1656889 RepID=A0A849AGI7_9MICO|nr:MULTISPECIES: hypothetical protein [Flexivirga]NNG39954.1 hypothetical protein [Flexivirga aerilata]